MRMRTVIKVGPIDKANLDSAYRIPSSTLSDLPTCLNASSGQFVRVVHSGLTISAGDFAMQNRSIQQELLRVFLPLRRPFNLIQGCFLAMR